MNRRLKLVGQLSRDGGGHAGDEDVLRGRVGLDQTPFADAISLQACAFAVAGCSHYLAQSVCWPSRIRR